MAGTSEKADVEVVWAGGHHTSGQITRPVACLAQLSYYSQLAQRAGDLAEAGLTFAQIAGQLNTEGFRPPKRCPAFTANAVSDLMRAAGIRRPAAPAPGPARMVATRPGHVRDHPRFLGPPRMGRRLPAPGH